MKLKEREEKWVGGREPETEGPKREDGRKELEGGRDSDGGREELARLGSPAHQVYEEVLST